MRILALDTSTRSCSVAVTDQAMILSEITSENGQSHSRHAMAMVHSALEFAQTDIRNIDGFAFTAGPGSFTGLRIGISTIMGLAAAACKPVAGISGLEALALQAAVPDKVICPMIDAGRKEIYTARYRWIDEKLIRESDDQVLAPDTAIQRLSTPAVFTGNGVRSCRAAIQERLGNLACFAPDGQGVLRAATIAAIARKRFDVHDEDDIFHFKPLYIRKSDAKIPAPFKF